MILLVQVKTVKNHLVHKQLINTTTASEVNELIQKYEDRSKKIRKQLIDITLYTEGCFSYKELEEYPVTVIKDINEAIKEKNERTREMMDQAKGTKRKVF